MTDKIRQAAVKCAIEVSKDYAAGVFEYLRADAVSVLASIIERAMRKLLAERVKEAERNGRWIQHQVHCPYCNQGARGCDIGRGLEAKR